MQLTELDIGRVAALGRGDLILDEKPEGVAKTIEDELKTSGAQMLQELPDSPGQPNAEGSQTKEGCGL